MILFKQMFCQVYDSDRRVLRIQDIILGGFNVISGSLFKLTLMLETLTQRGIGQGEQDIIFLGNVIQCFLKIPLCDIKLTLTAIDPAQCEVVHSLIVGIIQAFEKHFLADVIVFIGIDRIVHIYCQPLIDYTIIEIIQGLNTVVQLRKIKIDRL